MKRGLVLALVVLLFPAVFFAQATKSDLKPEQIIRLWFDRWNALDGSAQTTDQLLELYGPDGPDALHQVGPSTGQAGPPVRFEGQSAIRKMIDDFAKANRDISFKIQTVSANEKAVELFHIADSPKGGVSVALEYGAAYTVRADKRRWMYPGAAFFQIQDGKIRSVRLINARDEMMEVFDPQ